MKEKHFKPRQAEYWALRDRLRREYRDLGGHEFWQGLEELSEDPEFQDYLANEFPENAVDSLDPVGRRRFLQLMGASLALAGVSACTKQPPEKIVPYVKQPEELVPGNPLFYASAMVMGGRARGILAESHMGRPTKLEGNPLHPASLGATDLFTQASVLSLYDPDRSQVVKSARQIRSWDAFFSAFRPALERQRQSEGRGLRILSETVSSPTRAALLKRVKETFPQFELHQYEPLNRDAVFEATKRLFGRPLDARFRFDRAEVVVSLDSDFLYFGDAPVRAARQIASSRRAAEGGEAFNRIYAAESCHTVTGAYADHRLPCRPSRIVSLVQALAAAAGAGASAPALSVDEQAWIDAAGEDLNSHRGRSLVVVGDHQPAEVHAWAYLINKALGNWGGTLEFSDPIDDFPVNQTGSLRDLVAAINHDRVELLLILGGNPVYNAPADLEFGEALKKVGLRVRLGLYEDETSELCHWHLPDLHYLEAWSDARAFDGTVTIRQPLIAPLYGGKSADQMLAFLAGDEGVSDYELIREYWQANRSEGDFESAWRRAVHDGVFEGTRLPGLAPAVVGDPGGLATSGESPEGTMELIFLPDPTVYDGSFANSGWLQEAPKQLSKLTWDNALLLSPRTAAQLAGKTDWLPYRGGDREWPLNQTIVEIEYRGRKLEAAAWVLPGHADDCATLYLGGGRVRAGRVGNAVGFNAYALRTSDAPGFGPGAKIIPTGRPYRLACVQDHFRLEGRNHLRSASLDEFRDNPSFVEKLEHMPEGLPTLYPEHPYQGYSWGMAIDLNACTGCNACVLACQAENNIAVVGKEQVLNGREMHWIRVDRYFKGDVGNPRAYHQPMPCQQCEHAPCEPVCPVGATVHSDEGLNDMVYNRCVGTRYCANNCPYKVRRFNFYRYSDLTTPVRKLQYNPDVTVRVRGVMEKCTYCVQRISQARIAAKRDDRKIQDGEIQTACQQVCPSEAIVFGDINDPQSRVSQLRRDPRHYSVLRELGTRPRTTYLAKLENTHPDLAGSDEEETHGKH